MTSLRPIDRWFIDEILPHEAHFLRIAQRLTRSQDQAVDLVQEAYCRLFDSSGWTALQDPRGYTVRMIRNLAISQMRRARIVEFEQWVEVDGLAIADDDPDPFRIAAGRQAVARADAALETMPERCRTALVQCRLEEQSPRSVATAMGLSLSTLEKRLARGLKLLAAALYPCDGGDAPAAPLADTAPSQTVAVPAYEDRHASGSADR
ncbi:RNA polymerase sigma factor [Sphingomonas abietis]|uniref:RNA polymerase sigma factor n=1 Tax=Sphingomonas abietis TaxID=3012344 RepID=A0ABY7NTY4_9SPHN|nr:RNA polymerase sigma factor [Sphingomonas abietis]WBO22911.1 RNA polymerase sigma factor [Sphingomonas abietis]